MAVEEAAGGEHGGGHAPDATSALGAWLVPGRRAALRDVWRAFWVTRLVVLAAGVVAATVVEAAPGAARGFDPQGFTTPFGALGDALVAAAARWDAVWYLTIAHDGYQASEARPAFFPLYPGLARAAGLVLGGPLLGGIAVSLVCFGVASYLLHRLTALELGPDAARAAVWVTAAFPMAFFFSAVYSEALFLALSVGCVYAARTDRWAWAGLLGALATGTRSAGVVLLVPLAILAWQQRSTSAAPGFWRRAGWLALVPVGIGAFSAWMALRGSGAGAAWTAQAAWSRELSWPFAAVRDGAVAAWQGAAQLASGSRTPVRFDGAGGDPFLAAWTNLGLWAFLLLGLVALVGVARRLPRAYAAYVVAALALPLSAPVGPQPLMSLPRFEAVLFPLAMWGGWWLARRRPATRAALLAVGLVGLALATGRFVSWRWVA